MNSSSPPVSAIAAPELRHQLRTPLNHIIGYCEILIDEYPGAPFIPRLERIASDARAMVEAIQQMAGEQTSLPAHTFSTLRDRLEPGAAGIEDAVEGLASAIPASGHSDLGRIGIACRALRDTLEGNRFEVPGAPLQWLDTQSEKPAALRPEATGRILVVDDDEMNRDMLSRQLERQRHEVAVAANGPTALSMLRAQRFDIMLLDLMMPGMNGFEVLETVKRDPALNGVAVILVSALDEMDTVARSIEAGAEDYLFKPLNPTLLRARIRSTLEKLRDTETVRRKQRLESIGLLAAGIAHDFNNLLTGIIGNAQLLGQSLQSEADRGMAEAIERAGERAAELTRQLLAYSGKAMFRMENVDLASLIRDTESLIHASLPKAVRLTLHLPQGPAVTADKNQIRQALLNLTLNAGEAIGPDSAGLVTIETGSEDVASGAAFDVVADEVKPGLYSWIEVRDSGCGMDHATVSRMFEPFFTTKFLGRGLGLAAVAGIVRSHLGLMRVTSAPGQGSALRLYFPATSGAPEPAIDTSSYVLVVDDEPIVRQIVKVALERTGRRVLQAESGGSALEILRRMHNRIGLVLLDWKMPLMDGSRTLTLMRELRPDLKVIVSSGVGQMDAEAQFRELGITAYLQKPYRMSELIQVVENAAGDNQSS